MLLRTYGYIFSALILVGANSLSYAQEKEATDTVKTTRAVKDTTTGKFIPTGVRFGVDVLAIARSFITDDFNGWEVAADIDFYRFYLVAEYGTWSVHNLIDSGYYANEGTYFRVGADVNFLFKDPDKNMFFLGARFGRSSYSDESTYDYYVPHYDPNIISVSNPHVVATWVEMTAGLKVKIWGAFWLGATGRFKFGLDLDGNGELTSYDVPGYGRNFKSIAWGFNYYVLFRIPVRKQR